MFLKKENELDFACQSCGNCCRNFSINITHLDIERILENRPDLNTKDFVSFSASTEKDDAESFVATYGKRQMTLKKKAGSQECVFLVNNICSIHPFKPRVCKVWPFSLEKGNRITWIQEHRGFIKKSCRHTSVPGANDPEELIPLIKQHYKERKVFSKIVEKWNEEKKQLVKKDEIFSDILDEDFLAFIIDEANIKKQAELETSHEDSLLEKVISSLIKDRRVDAITSTNYLNTYSESRNPDITLNIFIQDNNIESFLEKSNIDKLKESFTATNYTINTLNQSCSFIIVGKVMEEENIQINNKLLKLYIHHFNELYKPLPYDSKVIYNSYSLDIKIAKMYDQTRTELEQIYNKFWFNLEQLLVYLKYDNFLDAKILMNSIFNLEFCSMLYWLNQKHITLDDISFMPYKTDDLANFIKYFGNYSDKAGQINQLNKLIDIFQRTWKFTGLTINNPLEDEVKNQLLLLEK